MSGYVLCLSNPSFANCFYIGVTSKKPNERADELYSEGVLWPFKIELAKQVSKIDGKQVSLHRLIGKMGDRLTPDRDYFDVPIEVVQNLFDLIDGEPWTETAGTTVSAGDKVLGFLKQEYPKLNAMQLGQLKVRVMAGLKAQGDAEPTLESVRGLLDVKATITPV